MFQVSYFSTNYENNFKDRGSFLLVTRLKFDVFQHKSLLFHRVYPYYHGYIITFNILTFVANI